MNEMDELTILWSAETKHDMDQFSKYSVVVKAADWLIKYYEVFLHFDTVSLLGNVIFCAYVCSLKIYV